jgi:hypothetical protein
MAGNQERSNKKKQVNAVIIAAIILKNIVMDYTSIHKPEETVGGFSRKKYKVAALYSTLSLLGSNRGEFGYNLIKCNLAFS